MSSIGDLLYEDFDELRKAHLKFDQEIVDWAQELTDDWLHEEMIYESSVFKKDWKLPRWIFVTHMFNHQTHHRGQLTTILKQLGYEPGITDIPCLPQLEAGIIK